MTLCCPPASLQGFRDKALQMPEFAVVGSAEWRWGHWWAGHLPGNSSPARSAAASCTWSFNWPMCRLDNSLFITVIIMQSDTTYLQNVLEMHYLYRNHVHWDPFSPWWLQIMWKALLWFISRAKDIGLFGIIHSTSKWIYFHTTLNLPLGLVTQALL